MKSPSRKKPDERKHIDQDTIALFKEVKRRCTSSAKKVLRAYQDIILNQTPARVDSKNITTEDGIGYRPLCSMLAHIFPRSQHDKLLKLLLNLSNKGDGQIRTATLMDISHTRRAGGKSAEEHLKDTKPPEKGLLRAFDTWMFAPDLAHAAKMVNMRKGRYIRRLVDAKDTFQMGEMLCTVGRAYRRRDAFVLIRPASSRREYRVLGMYSRFIYRQNEGVSLPQCSKVGRETRGASEFAASVSTPATVEQLDDMPCLAVDMWSSDISRAPLGFLRELDHYYRETGESLAKLDLFEETKCTYFTPPFLQQECPAWRVRGMKFDMSSLDARIAIESISAPFPAQVRNNKRHRIPKDADERVLRIIDKYNRMLGPSVLEARATEASRLAGYEGHAFKVVRRHLRRGYAYKSRWVIHRASTLVQAVIVGEERAIEEVSMRIVALGTQLHRMVLTVGKSPITKNLALIANVSVHQKMGPLLVSALREYCSEIDELECFATMFIEGITNMTGERISYDAETNQWSNPFTTVEVPFIEQ